MADWNAWRKQACDEWGRIYAFRAMLADWDDRLSPEAKILLRIDVERSERLLLSLLDRQAKACGLDDASEV